MPKVLKDIVSERMLAIRKFAHYKEIADKYEERTGKKWRDLSKKARADLLGGSSSVDDSLLLAYCTDILYKDFYEKSMTFLNKHIYALWSRMMNDENYRNTEYRYEMVVGEVQLGEHFNKVLYELTWFKRLKTGDIVLKLTVRERKDSYMTAAENEALCKVYIVEEGSRNIEEALLSIFGKVMQYSVYGVVSNK